MERINLCGDLYNMTKNGICIGALKRDESAVAVAVVAICQYFLLLLPSLPLWLASSRSFVFVRDLIKRERERAKMDEDNDFNNNNNQLYKANDNEGVNPMYTDKETVKNTKWVWEGKKKK